MDDKSVELKVGNGKIDDDTVESNIDISTIDEISTEDKKNDTLNTNLLYRVDESPPWYIAMVFGFQQLMLCLSIVTFPLIIMSILCADDSPSVSDYKTAQIGTVLFIAGTSTFVQTTFGVSPMFIGGITGFILDNIAPGTRKERGLETFYAKYSASSGGSLAAYQLPFSTDGNWTKWIPICPKFDTAKRRFSTSA
ncbi:uncharacterized protein LOC120335428 [Styela clava]